MYLAVVLYLVLVLQTKAFFFAENITDYEKLADPDVLQQLTPQISPTQSPVATITIAPPTPSSVEVPKNYTPSNNETQQEETPETTEATATPVDPSAAIYKKAFMIAPRVTGKQCIDFKMCNFTINLDLLT